MKIKRQIVQNQEVSQGHPQCVFKGMFFVHIFKICSGPDRWLHNILEMEPKEKGACFMSGKGRIFSGYESLPGGMAADTVMAGCMVLEGGAFRGLYGEGVLDALMEADINLQCTIGVSAGAMNGFSYTAGQIGLAARLNLKYRHDSRYVGWKAFLHNKGVIGFDFALHQFLADQSFDYERFYRNDRRFIAVATNVETGRSEYFEKGVCGDIFQAIRASASMPYLSAPVMVDGIACLDGGCCEKVPYRWALDQGFEKIVLVMTREPSYRRNEKSKSDTMAKFFYRRYPAFIPVQSTSSERANRDYERISELASDGRIFLISPSRQMDISRLEGDMEKLGALYHLGYEDGKAAIPALRTYLKI